MSRWFELKLDSPQANQLKKAVRVFTQVAYTDREQPPIMFSDSSISNKAYLYLSPDWIVLVSNAANFRMPPVATMLVMKSSSMSSYRCTKVCRALCISLYRLKCLLERNAASSVTLYGDVQVQDRIFFQIGNDDGVVVYSSILPVISWTDHVELDPGFLNPEYPKKLRLSSEKFLDVLTQLDSFGFKVHAKVSAAQVVFQVVNAKFVLIREPGECEPESVGDRYPFVLKFDIKHKRAFHNAAIISEMVWIFESAGLVSALQFNIGGLEKYKSKIPNAEIERCLLGMTKNPCIIPL